MRGGATISRPRRPAWTGTPISAGAGLGRQDDFVVWQPSAVTGTSALIASQPVETWQDYLVFHLVEHYAGVLPKAFGGMPDDREAQAIAATNAALGEGVGRLYVAQYFPPQAKATAEAMVANIRTAYAAHIAGAGWMSAGNARQIHGQIGSAKDRRWLSGCMDR